MKSITHYWHSINPVSIALAPVSYFFCLLVSLRRLLYCKGIIKSCAASVPVIVVGNIYIGGNGKTPFVIWLVEQLQQAGYKPAVVSRGYGAIAQAEGFPWPRLVDRQQDTQLYGDEPFLIHQVTGCPVLVDPQRCRAVKAVTEHTDCDVIISDDGLQHYAMQRFMEINISDGSKLYGNGLCLPAGPLRETVSRLNSVDYIIYNVSRGQLSLAVKAKMQLRKNGLLSDRNEFFMDYTFSTVHSIPAGNVSQGSGQSMTLSDFKGKIIHAVAGIGAPEQFFKLLTAHGLKVIEHPFADHHQYQQNELVFDDTGESYPVIMTEKDAVKCRSFSLQNLWYLPVKASLDDGLTDCILAQLKLYKAHLNKEV